MATIYVTTKRVERFGDKFCTRDAWASLKEARRFFERFKRDPDVAACELVRVTGGMARTETVVESYRRGKS